MVDLKFRQLRDRIDGIEKCMGVRMNETKNGMHSGGCFGLSDEGQIRNIKVMNTITLPELSGWRSRIDCPPTPPPPPGQNACTH